jgi:hypothetical protein
VSGNTKGKKGPGGGDQKKKGRAAGHRLPVADTRFLKVGGGKVTTRSRSVKKRG